MIDADEVHGIYGGTDAALGEYPYVVHLKLTGSTGVTNECNGVLFAANLVLTTGNLVEIIDQGIIYVTL
jgi:hypothetical protein